MIDFGDLEVAEEVVGESLQAAREEEQRAWAALKEEKRRADEEEKADRMHKARVKYARVQEAKALKAEREAEKEQAAAQASPSEPAPFPVPQVKTLAGKEERKKKYKWLLQLDEDAMKVVDEHRVLEEVPEEEKFDCTCWQIITAGPQPEMTSLETIKSQVKKSDLLSVFGPQKPSGARRAGGRFSAALAKGGLAALNFCKRSKNPEDGESTVDPSEISTADPTEAWEGSEEDLSSCDGCSEPDIAP